MVVVCEYNLCLLYFVIPQGLRLTEVGTKDTKSAKSKYISPAVASEWNKDNYIYKISIMTPRIIC